MLENLDDRAWLEPPNYEANSVLKCYWCEKGIFEDEEYYEIEGKPYCDYCLNDNFRKYAYREEWEE